jgi:hypothetical protein
MLRQDAALRNRRPFEKIRNQLLQLVAIFVKNGKILEWIDATNEIEPGRYKADATNRIASETGPL